MREQVASPEETSSLMLERSRKTNKDLFLAMYRTVLLLKDDGATYIVIDIRFEQQIWDVIATTAIQDPNDDRVVYLPDAASSTSSHHS